ncbi:WecB/TagA/CpsF family glycosyltransferase [Arthrobacter sp. YA7-1]|uniref:WecB/TagA/CpsF family glycosyltransferase n=1 Tax=Arthrobacter sp. YA7-1 TaxID=2987701 RepID=UPI0022271C2E|nr:WecB/TagA/CpsF family glycosyltransferase [Arthrobacter sp. YA7-1]UYY80862.1 WecB/TagA/CpsF family glycosyltransferase [Arthrobacter sp. YA7-1]
MDNIDDLSWSYLGDILGFSTTKIGSVSFSVARIDEVVESALKNAISGQGQNLRFSNAYCVGLADRDELYRRALEAPGQNFADGLPVAWLIRRASGRPEPLSAFRVRGPTFFENVIANGCKHGLRHTFVGATSSTLDLLVEWARENYPNSTIAGVYAPPFAPLDGEFIEGICNEIEKQDPQIVWLGLGTPKQDLAAEKLALRFPSLTFASVGAAFDFKAGTASEAPLWIQKSGFEWFYRLIKEPRRLWKRYTIGSFYFLRSVLRTRP